MSRQVATKILFIFFFIVIACYGIKAVALVPVSVSIAYKSEPLSQHSGQIPDSELKGTHFRLPAGHAVVQKNLVPSYFSLDAVFYEPRNALENFQIRKSSQFIKDYLAHIYPSHNFW